MFGSIYFGAAFFGASSVSPLTLLGLWRLVSTMPSKLVFHTMLEFDGQFWVIGGTNGIDFSQKVFKSSDQGFTWSEVGSDALPVALQDHMSLVFDGKMWVLGGVSNAGVETGVYSSSDGLTWTHEGDLPAPVGSGVVVAFGGKMLVIGGYDESFAGRRSVFSSVDGAVWVNEGDVLPIDLYASAGAVFNQEIFLLGGFSDTLGSGSSRVYHSANGLAWSELGSNVLPHVIDGAGTAVFKGQLWLIGGWAYDATGPSQDVFSSRDGLTWTPEPSLLDPVAYGEIIVSDETLWGSGGYRAASGDDAILDTVYALSPLSGHGSIDYGPPDVQGVGTVVGGRDSNFGVGQVIPKRKRLVGRGRIVWPTPLVAGFGLVISPVVPEDIIEVEEEAFMAPDDDEAELLWILRELEMSK